MPLVQFKNAFKSVLSNLISKFLGCRDPRWKHEYLDSGQSWLMTGEEEEEEEEVNESDKHI